MTYDPNHQKPTPLKESDIKWASYIFYGILVLASLGAVLLETSGCCWQ